MTVLANNTRLIKVGKDYSAGSGISIDDYVISVTGEFGKTYSAGENIGIYEQDNQLYISGKDWTNTITAASANAYNKEREAFNIWQVEHYYVDVQNTRALISNKLDESAFSSVSGTFLTAHQSLDGYATTSWVDEQGYITGVDLSNYYTKNETSGADQLADAFANIPAGDVGVNTYVQNNSATINDVNTTYQANSGSYQPSGNYIPYTAVDSGIYKAFVTNSGLDIRTLGVGGLYATRIDPSIIQLSYVSEGKILGFTDLTNTHLRFETETDSAYVDREKIHIWDSATNYIQNNSATNDEVNTSYQTNSGTFLTAVDLNPYQTTAGMVDYAKASALDNLTNDYSSNSSVWNDTTNVVQTNSAQWAEGGGEFPASADEAITTYQSNSGLYLTAQQNADWTATAGVTQILNKPEEVSYELLNLSAGPGIDIQEIQDAIVISATGGGGGGVPQSAFDELKASYDALSSLFATYSGQWLLPNEGV